MLSTTETLAAATVLVGAAAIEEIFDLSTAQTEMRNAALAVTTSWWDAFAKRMSPEQFYHRFRIWPSALQRLVHLHYEWPPCELTDESWHNILNSDAAKFICHASEYMVHGT